MTYEKLDNSGALNADDSLNEDRESRNKSWLVRLAKAFSFKRDGEKFVTTKVRFPRWNPIRKPDVNWSPTQKHKPRQKRAIRIVSAKDRAKAVQSSA